MKLKKVIIAVILISLYVMPAAQASPTVISGTASCYMPPIFEMNTQASQTEKPDEQKPAGEPEATVTSGNFEIQKERLYVQLEKKINTKDTIAEKGESMIVYTLCAK